MMIYSIVLATSLAGAYQQPEYKASIAHDYSSASNINILVLLSSSKYHYHRFAKEHPWAEHLTSLPKRRLGALSSECFRI